MAQALAVEAPDSVPLFPTYDAEEDDGEAEAAPFLLSPLTASGGPSWQALTAMALDACTLEAEAERPPSPLEPPAEDDCPQLPSADVVAAGWDAAFDGQAEAPVMEEEEDGDPVDDLARDEDGREEPPAASVAMAAEDVATSSQPSDKDAAERGGGPDDTAGPPDLEVEGLPDWLQGEAADRIYRDEIARQIARIVKRLGLDGLTPSTFSRTLQAHFKVDLYQTDLRPFINRTLDDCLSQLAAMPAPSPRRRGPSSRAEPPPQSAYDRFLAAYRAQAEADGEDAAGAEHQRRAAAAWEALAPEERRAYGAAEGAG
eukprot:EG_transcript_20641